MEMIKISDDPIIQNDIEAIVSRQPVVWTDFMNKSILITGATGLIGGQLLRTFVLVDKIYGLKLKIYALVRNKIKAEKLLSEMENVTEIILVEQNITNDIKLFEHVDFIIHCASITDSWSFVNNPVETIETSLKGCENILKFAAKKGAESVVYLSSMEVYGQSDKEFISEVDYGYLDPVKTRSSYPEAKRMCECICKAYAEEFNVPVKIARLTQTFGPGVDYKDNRVFAEFARAVIEKRDIVLHTMGRTERNYCYTRDALTALLILLERGKDGEAYNIANEKTEISIYAMAQMLALKYFNDVGRVKIEIEDEQQRGYNPEGRTCISSSKMRKLGWTPEVGLEKMFDYLISSMKFNKVRISGCIN